MGAKRYELSDEQWEQIKEMFPKAKTGRPPKDNRMMMNAILWLACSGAAWADIPGALWFIQNSIQSFLQMER